MAGSLGGKMWLRCALASTARIYMALVMALVPLQTSAMLQGHARMRLVPRSSRLLMDSGPLAEDLTWDALEEETLTPELSLTSRDEVLLERFGIFEDLMHVAK